MANLTQIELPNGTTYDIEDAKKKGVYVVKGTHTTATVAWTGAIDVDALYDGLTIVYYLPISATSGSTQVTLNLTLSGGTTTGAINCYYNASKLTRSYYPAGSSILMTYWSAGSISISGTATTAARWIAGADYNANTWRNITIDGTQAYSTSTSSGALALISGTNVNIASDGGAPAKVTISATDTNTIAGMADVQLTSPTDNDLLVYDSNLSGGKTWKNAKKIVTCTKAQFDAWSANNTFPYTDCKYIVTDVNNINNPTALEIPYDNTSSGLSATNVQSAIDEVNAEKANVSDFQVFSECARNTADVTTTDTKVTLKTKTFTVSRNSTILISFFGVIKTSRFTSALNIYLDNSDIGYTCTNLTSYTTVYGYTTHNISSGSHTIELKLSGQDSGTTATMPSYNSFGFSAVIIPR